MDVLRAQLVSHSDRVWFECDGVELPVPDHLKPVLEKGQYGEGVSIGIRPEEINLSLTEAPAPAFACELYVVEHLPRKSILCLEQGDQLVKVNTLAGFRGSVGDRIWLTFPKDRILLFDPKTLLTFV
jgi:multiple sugar transport system ATP-binding protein